MNGLARRNLLFPLGYFPIAFVAVVYNQWFIYGHAQEQVAASHYHPALLLAAAFLLQALLSPISGRVSDYFFQLLGSRRPLLLVAVPLLAVCFYQLWQALSIVVVIAYSFFFMLSTQTYLSLLPRLTSSDRHRTLLSVMGSLLAMGATVAALTLGPYLVVNDSIMALGWWGGLILLVGLLLPTAVYRAQDHTGTNSPVQQTPTLGRVLDQSFRQSSYGRFLIANMLIYFASTALTMVSPFFVTAVLQRPESYVATMNISIASGMVAGVVAMMALQRRFSAMGVYQWVAAVQLLMIGLGAAKLLVPAALGLVPWPLVFFGIGGFMVSTMALPPVIISQYIDRLRTSHEASLFAINGTAINLGSSLAALSMAFIVVQRDTLNDVVSITGLIGLGAVLVGALLAGIRLLAHAAKNDTRETPCQDTLA